jgi:hypothetical protein
LQLGAATGFNVDVRMRAGRSFALLVEAGCMVERATWRVPTRFVSQRVWSCALVVDAVERFRVLDLEKHARMKERGGGL